MLLPMVLAGRLLPKLWRKRSQVAVASAFRSLISCAMHSQLGRDRWWGSKRAEAALSRRVETAQDEQKMQLRMRDIRCELKTYKSNHIA